MENNSIEITKVETKKETIVEKAKGFWGRHPKLHKVVKGVGIGAAAVAVGTGAFLLGKRSCDVVYVYDTPEEGNVDVPATEYDDSSVAVEDYAVESED